MADVWKSQGRKFCEICKVWFGDNRASIEFHERGKKHKDALAAKLRELSRASREKEKTQAQTKSVLAAMEAAALKAMRENGEGIEHGPALPSTGLASNIFDPRQIKDIGSMAREMAKRKNEIQEVRSQKRVAPSSPCITPKYFRRELCAPVEYIESDIVTAKQEHNSFPSCVDTVWVEANADGGRTYYYNMLTGVSQWEQPDSFYTADEYRRCFLENKLSASTIKTDSFKQEELSMNTGSLKVVTSVALEEKAADEPVIKTECHVEGSTNRFHDVSHIPLPGAESSATDVAVKQEPIEPTRESTVSPTITVDIDFSHGNYPPVVTSRSPTVHLEEESLGPSHGPYGSWQRVMEENNQPKFSPLTAKYRAQEQHERMLTEEKGKLAAKAEVKMEFSEKTGPVFTKKVKGPIEFKKRSTAKSVRQRMQ